MRKCCLSSLNKRLVELKQEREQALKYQEWQNKFQFFESARLAATIREREKELLALTGLIGDQNVEIQRIQSDRSIEENELAYLRADLKEIDEQINQKSGADYLKLLSSLEELKGSIKVAEQTIIRLQRDKEVEPRSHYPQLPGYQKGRDTDNGMQRRDPEPEY